MKHPAPNLNALWSTLLIEELVRNGVRHFCVPSGSRSAPLVTAVAAHPEIRAVHHFDERGAAFHVLGYGRATGKPAAVITTSGTAVANAWPAVVEASVDRVPMILLTADRPPELQDSGSNQTIDQVKFFGPYVRWQLPLPCPHHRNRTGSDPHRGGSSGLSRMPVTPRAGPDQLYVSGASHPHGHRP